MAQRSTIDGLALLRGSRDNRAGAAFLLTTEATTSVAWTRGDDWTVAIREGSRYVVASGGTAREYLKVWPVAHAVTQEALDVWSARGFADLLTGNPYGNHVAFWDAEPGSVLRIVGRQPLTASVGDLKLVARNAAGELVAAQPPVEDWHGSMRFYRTSQVTDDPFESLRCLWLAVENLLDDKIKEKVSGDSEENWLKHTLQLAEQHVNLTTYLPSPPASGTAKAPYNAAYEYFYNEVRHDLFHAKASRQPSLPHDAVAVAAMSARHEQLTRLYLDLLSATTGVRRTGGGGLAYGGFARATSLLDESPRIFLTNDPTPFDRDETLAAPLGRQVVDGPAITVADQERPWLKVYLATMPGSAVEGLGTVTRMTLEADGTSAMAYLMEGALQIRNVDQVEAQIDISLDNIRQPKHFIFG
jgi:hypothetical protein